MLGTHESARRGCTHNLIVKPHRLLILLISALALVTGLVGTAHAQSKHAMLLEVDDVINAPMGEYIKRAFVKAETGATELVIVCLDTPGGELDATREIVEVLLGSPVPSVVYVSPRGARAGSAGTFITAAANFAVMAPGTNIGAATPVASGGEDLPETLADKTTNDAAALIRAIAEERGRNAESLEETVRQATSFSATEATALNVVDFIATDLQDLLAQLDGQVAFTPAGAKTLNTQNLNVDRTGMDILERFRLLLADPNISFILLSLGGLGIAVELFNPGLIVPGVVGAILLLLAFLGLGSLPVNWAGVAFILLAFLLFVAETQVAGFGVLGFGAIVSFVVGGFLLFFHLGPPSPIEPSVRVGLAVLIPMAVVLLSGAGWVVTAMVRSRSPATVSTAETVVGKIGIVTSALDPIGTVQLESELWTAIAEDDRLVEAGEKVEVTGLEGLTLRVSKIKEAGV
jgi:membrane-bound serine protease (ClpP class)